MGVLMADLTGEGRKRDRLKDRELQAPILQADVVGRLAEGRSKEHGSGRRLADYGPVDPAPLAVEVGHVPIAVGLSGLLVGPFRGTSRQGSIQLVGRQTGLPTPSDKRAVVGVAHGVMPPSCSVWSFHSLCSNFSMFAPTLHL